MSETSPEIAHSSAPLIVDSWVDSACPYTFRANQWLQEVAEHRGLVIRWNVFSLKILNDSDQAKHIASHRVSRMVAWLMRHDDQEAAGNLYLTVAERIHEHREKPEEAERAALADFSPELRAQLVDVAENSELDDLIQESQDRALKMVGRGVGLPIIGINGEGFSGPIMNPVVTGDDALKLWDAYTMLHSLPQFFELKRAKRRPQQRR